ncbi:hypothetical protein [Mycolicibacterium sarraceniae]|uniref:hypothetical protein n=1 Tax=Mycolicibacterium sarraceniae TaxID=1534348 RepID=UPI0022A73137|nr:hypothetical protein [Mycolicibacterium sarraceniae]
MTHVLLPVSLLLRRAYAAELVWAVLQARAAGVGHRRIAAAAGIPACTVRRWLRVIGRRVEAVRQWFIGVAVTAGGGGVDTSGDRHSCRGCSGCGGRGEGGDGVPVRAGTAGRRGDGGFSGGGVQRCPAARAGVAAGVGVGGCNTSCPLMRGGVDGPSSRG